MSSTNERLECLEREHLAASIQIAGKKEKEKNMTKRIDSGGAPLLLIYMNDYRAVPQYFASVTPALSAIQLDHFRCSCNHYPDV